MSTKALGITDGRDLALGLPHAAIRHRRRHVTPRVFAAVKRLGAVGFAFFLIKGLAWLVVLALLAWERC